ncbi:hypothetical protein KHS38_09385 [Mucilaginibacter sp. Bleaf8]|uniref:hypothetical protein n=1 Tax=Mucilaginibacter sp. Bleaf8 TaxID=2834430 RepID=UPI001BCCF9D2|nr:hypothetical protein [Mucilaginibacter sp. Bleaf8]MBS7564618.1 hypothetical protein [Mucilaginibacter sp. Bleaf8]
MNEELDDELRKRISEVFDHYEEDTTAADEGWLMLREKFPPQKERRIIGVWVWRGAAAAVLLLLCMFGLWLSKRQANENQLAVKPVKPSNQLPAVNNKLPQLPDDSVTQKPVPSPTETFAGNQPQSLDADVPGQKSLYANKKRLDVRWPGSVAEIADDRTYAKLNNPSLPPLAADISTPGSATNQSVNNGLAGNKVPATVNGQQAAGKEPSDFEALEKVKQVLAATIQKDSSAQSIFKKPGMNDLFAREAQERANKPKDDKKTDAEKRIIYSVYAATYVNYAKGSSTQANIGAGFTSDIRLVGNLKLSTGLAIAQNKLDYNAEPTQPGLRTAAIQASRLNADVSTMNAVLPNKISEFAPRNGVSSVSVKGYNVSLTGLDVPINLKYEFNPKKTDSYISAGLSSSTFINETYRYQYDNSLQNAFGLSSEAIPDASSSTSFSRFDFARTLNVAVGVGMPLGKSNRLVIEPFVKYPLSGLGSQDIRFGAGGVNLKLRFQKSNK